MNNTKKLASPRGCLSRLVRHLFRVWHSPYAPSWMPIETAPKDGTEIIVYCPSAHGIQHMASVCAYHEDAGFCVDELREPTIWIPLPNVNVDASADKKSN